MFPPRPEYVISTDQLHKYEKTHLIQVKLNGSCCTIFIKGDELRQFGRHQNENLSNFKINQENLKVLNCGNNEWNVVVGEYMNKSKKDESKKDDEEKKKQSGKKESLDTEEEIIDNKEKDTKEPKAPETKQESINFELDTNKNTTGKQKNFEEALQSFIGCSVKIE